MRRRQWHELPRWQRSAVLVLAPIELVLTAAAAADLARRPQRLIQGPKKLWWLGIFVQPIGPVAYLCWGRRAGREWGGNPGR
ncbi:MAG TPA: PLDc N-terminal domain-containing protein [Micromonosporaceae bacterium]